MAAVERRLDNLNSNQGAMLNSTLERRKLRIVLDSLMRKDTITRNPDEIDMECCEYYTKAFRKRNALYDKLTPEWKKKYEPKEDIDGNIYTQATLTLTDDELKGIIAKLPNGKAAGPSGIPYELIKKAKKMTQSRLRVLSVLFC